MNILLLGGDSRYLEIIDYLKNDHDITTVGYKKINIEKTKNIEINDIDISKYDIIIFPIGGIKDNNIINSEFCDEKIKLSDEFLNNCKENAIITSGIKTENLDKMLKSANKDCIYLMNDKDIVKQNSIITAEGIIADIIINTDKSINDSNILIFGYGNIGKILVNYLNMLGAKINVAIIEAKDQRNLDYLSINSFYSNNLDDLLDNISKADIIINTAPANIIDDPFIKYINKDAYFLDIASHPHCINKEALNDYFIKNKTYLGIPGKVAPKTSGKILSKKIKKIMEDN